MPLGLPAPNTISGGVGGSRGGLGQRGGSSGGTSTGTTTTTTPPSYGPQYTQTGTTLPPDSPYNPIPQAPPAVPMPIPPEVIQKREQDAYARWLESTGQSIQGAFNSQIAGAKASTQNQLALLNMRYDQLGANYGFDRALLDNSRYAQVDLARDQLGVDRTYAQAHWNNIQQDINNRRGNASTLYAIQQWLSGKTKNDLVGRRDLGFAQNMLNYRKQMRGLASAAIGAGAFTSQGHRDSRAETLETKHQSDRATRLDFSRAFNQLRAQDRRDALDRLATLQGLQTQWNQGLAGYNRDMANFGINSRGLDNLAARFRIQADQLADALRFAQDENLNQQIQTEGQQTVSGLTQQQIQALVQLLISSS